MYIKALLFSALCAFCISNSAHANLVINGDFENNSYGSTAFNQSNAAFTAGMNNATGFGGAGEIDVVTGTAFGIAPQSGNWKVGVHDQTGGLPFDAFSLDLASATVSGASYNLSLWLAGLGGNTLGPLEIGLSTSASSFGTLLASPTAASSNAWSLFSTTFSAPLSGSFLTFRPMSDSYVFIDNVSLTAQQVPEPATLALMGLGLAGFGWKKRKAS